MYFETENTLKTSIHMYKNMAYDTGSNTIFLAHTTAEIFIVLFSEQITP